MCWVIRYLGLEKWAVGYFYPDGKWYSHRVYAISAEAERMAHYLNGGNLQ